VEVDCVSVVSRGHSAEVLQAAEHALDGVAVAVMEGLEAVLPFAVRLGLDFRQWAAILHLFSESVEIVALVAMKDVEFGQLRKQRRASLAVGGVAAGEHEGDRPAVGVAQRVDLGRAAAARAANSLVLLHPFQPDAKRWAFTAEESISTCVGGLPASASAAKRSIHMPFVAQRT